jgi:hypothetical protein
VDWANRLVRKANVNTLRESGTIMTKRSITRSIFAIAVAAMGVALVPATTYAAPIVFTVNESPVIIPGVTPNIVTADKITSSYIENITFSGNQFTANLLVTFNGYDLNGVPQFNQIGTNTPAGEIGDPGDYGLYAIVTVQGTFTSAPDPSDANQTVFDFDPLTATANVFLNPDQVIGGDSLILTATTINTGPPTDGSVTTVTSTGQVVGGTFTLQFTNGQTQGAGLIYFPSFTGLTLVATATGDVDETSNLGATGGRVTGEASINFEGVAAPEPATLALFGMALFGSGIAARRRRKV